MAAVPVGPIDNTVYPPFTIAITGLDGYIAGGTLFFDANKDLLPDFLDLDGDGIQGTGEPSEVSRADRSRWADAPDHSRGLRSRRQRRD